jgi:TP53 regulating kinase-like protein
MELIAEGAEAKIYGIEFLGIKAIVKDRIEKKYREKSLDLLIRRQRTLNEARCMAQGNLAGANVPKVLSVYGNNIVTQRVIGKSLNGALKRDRGGRICARVAEAGRQLSILHTGHVIHGDFTPANILIDGSGVVWVIDFGLSEISDSVEGMALDVLLMKRSLGSKQYSSFSSGYRKRNGNARAVFARLAKIEERGRYRERSLIPTGE